VNFLFITVLLKINYLLLKINSQSYNNYRINNYMKLRCKGYIKCEMYPDHYRD